MPLARCIRAVFLCLAALPASSAPTPSSAATRLFIEPFATKAGADKLRADLTAELRKSNSLSIVSDPANADLILGGGGEIWVRAYRSFSPRAHMKMSANGTPVYGGYLSVELRNRRGVTVWSYLATPTAASEDVAKDLARLIAKQVVAAARLPESPVEPVAANQPGVSLTAAGATFPYPVYQKWFTNFHAGQPNITISYDPIGSEAGIRKLLAGAIDFGASDNPEAIHQLAPAQESRYLLFPSVVGAVVPIVNLPGISDDIVFTPEALAGIYLGKIKKWNAPVLARANRNIRLPDLAITVIHRSDGSGTSYAFTDYLSKTSPEWKSQVGSSLTPQWPAGRAASGNDGVAKQVKEFGGSIGYVEFAYALENRLGRGKVRNQNGDSVAASLESLSAAVQHAANIADDFKTSITDAPGEGSYPIATFTWVVVPARIADDPKRAAITAFLKWMLGPGQRQAAALGYFALPKELAAREESAIARIR